MSSSSSLDPLALFIQINHHIVNSCEILAKILMLFYSHLQALCGTIVSVPTLNGDKMQLNLTNEIVKPSTVKRIGGQGLPFPKEPNRKGDLLVNFDIKFPDSLTTAQKDILYDTLPNDN